MKINNIYDKIYYYILLIVKKNYWINLKMVIFKNIFITILIFIQIKKISKLMI